MIIRMLSIVLVTVVMLGVHTAEEEETPTEVHIKDASSPSPPDSFTLSLRMPGITTNKPDTYLVTPVKVEHDDVYVVGYVPKASASKVHHILIYGCTVPHRTDVSYWDVGDMGGNCAWDSPVSTILWAWALDAPKFNVPKGIGFHLGSSAKINYLILQVHYKFVVSEADSSGVDVVLTKSQPPRLAGIYLFATGGTTIPPHMSVNADTTCTYSDEEEIVPFAYRTHTHKLGVRVSAWRERENSWTLLGSGDPQKPQMFYLMEGEHHPVRTGDVLHGRCEFQSSLNTTTLIGSTGKDEMCNFYMMYHMAADKFKLKEGCFREVRFVVPDYAKIDLPSPPIQYQLDKTWPPHKLGQIGGLSHTADNAQLVVFHRAGNDWSSKEWFDDNNVVTDRTALIADNVILFIDPVNGNVTGSFGSGMFIMPHGVYVDHHGNLFVTDVARHQVLKFDKGKWDEPSLVLGTKFVPGSDSSHFCKPTSVVVNSADYIYVGDGYCNSRVVKFTKAGKYIGSYGSYSTAKGEVGKMFVVHDLTINHKERVIYVADRENGQIHSMTYKGVFTSIISIPGAVYAVDYIPELQAVAAVNITTAAGSSQVMIIDPYSGNITATLPDSPLTRPHALTYIKGCGIFVGEITSPFTLWKYREIRGDKGTPFLELITSRVPLPFLAVLAVLACIPILYISLVVVIRCRRDTQGEKFDRNGFQKLLRDYDSSDEEEDLVFKNSKIYNR